MIFFFGLSFLAFTYTKPDKIKSGQISFSYYCNVPKDIVVKGISRFDNYGEKQLIEFDKKADTETKKTLKLDTCEFNYISKTQFISKSKRETDVFFDPVIDLDGTDKSWGKYNTTNKRDTIYLGIKCHAYDIIFTKHKIQGLLVTLKNIKLYLNVDIGDIINRYSATKVDTLLADTKADIFARP
ncbi:MAG: hypothetical protein Q7W45_12850 [Bacteroidota bacterium]|nr:hypothetical protein [Bacteroidota bacterium]